MNETKAGKPGNAQGIEHGERRRESENRITEKGNGV